MLFDTTHTGYNSHIMKLLVVFVNLMVCAQGLSGCALFFHSDSACDGHILETIGCEDYGNDACEQYLRNGENYDMMIYKFPGGHSVDVHNFCKSGEPVIVKYYSDYSTPDGGRQCEGKEAREVYSDNKCYNINVGFEPGCLEFDCGTFNIS